MYTLALDNHSLKTKGQRSELDTTMASRNGQPTGAYLKVVLIGEPSVGKTALLDSYSNKKISKSQQPTIGADFVKKRATLSDGETQVSLQLWDTAG